MRRLLPITPALGLVLACHQAPAPLASPAKVPVASAAVAAPSVGASPAPSVPSASVQRASVTTLAPIARFPGRAWATRVEGRVVLYDLESVRVLAPDLRTVDRSYALAALFGSKTTRLFADAGLLIAAVGRGNHLSVGRLEPLTGKLSWRLELDGQPGNKQTVQVQRIYGVGDEVLLALGRDIGQQDPELVAVSARQGRLLFREPWQPAPDRALVAGAFLVEGFLQRIRARSVATGQIGWTREANSALFHLLAADQRRFVYSIQSVGATAEAIELFDLEHERVVASGSQPFAGPSTLDGDALFVSAPNGLVAYDDRTLHERFRVPSRSGFSASRPAAGDGVVYACLADATLVAVDRGTGALLWSYGLGLTGAHNVIDDTGPLVAPTDALGEAVVTQCASSGPTTRDTVVFARTGSETPPERTVIRGTVHWTRQPGLPTELDVLGFSVRTDENGRFELPIEARGVVAVRVHGTEDETFAIVPLTGRGSAGYTVTIEATPESF
jgi:outer membrane protein assembly factor BamB